MEQVIQGVVAWAGDEKKYGNYSFKLEDNDAWFRNPNRNGNVVQQGNLIKVKAKKNRRGDFEVVGVALVEESVSGAAGGSSGSTGGGERQASIVLQSSRNAAVALVGTLITAGAVKLSKSKPEANKVIVLDLVDELTARFYASAIDPASFLEARSEVESEEVEEEEAAESDSEPETGDDVVWE